MKKVNKNALLALIPIVLLALHGTALLGQEAKSANSSMVFLQKGEAVQVILSESLDSKSAKVNQSVSARLAQDVNIGGVVVIKKDTPVSVHVSQATPAPKRGGEPGKLEVAVDSVHAVNGRLIALDGLKSAEGENQVGKPVMKVFMSPGFNHGTNATIPSETIVNARVQADMNIDLSQKIPVAQTSSTSAAVNTKPDQ